MPTIKEQITRVALDIISSKPLGIRYSQLCAEINQRLPHINENTIKVYVPKLPRILPDQIYKPERGLFRHVNYRDTEEFPGKLVVDQLNEIELSTATSVSKAINYMLIPVQYHKRAYPSHIKPKITEVAAHFDIKQIRQDGLLSIHTEYSYRGRRLDSNLPSRFPELKKAHRDCIPRLWFNLQWSIEFADYIKELVGNKEPVVIEIHPPFNDYSNLDDFISNYAEFEKIILNNWPNVYIVIENRFGTMYRGGRFLISTVDDLKEFVKKIDQTPLQLGIALDIPQLFTAHGGCANLDNDSLKNIFFRLKTLMNRVLSIHLSGKSHIGNLNHLLNHDQKKKILFLKELFKRLCP